MTINNERLSEWMREVIEQAWYGVANNENPFAAAIYTVGGDRLALESNTAASTKQPSRHGEVNAIDAACQLLSNTKLPDAWLVASGEPCPMCAALAATTGIKHIAYGAAFKTISQAGYGTLGPDLNTFLMTTDAKIEIVSGIEEDACNRLLLQNPK